MSREPGMRNKIRVLLVDDHSVLRHGLKLFLNLQDDMTVIGEAGDGAEGVEKATALQPDVVVMDMVMPRMDGVEATRGIGVVCPSARVLILTTFVEDEQLFPALRAGAAGYMVKHSEPAQLADGIRTVYRGEPLLHPEVARRLMTQVAEGRRAPEGTITMVFTDIEGSTAMIAKLGDEAALLLFRQHDALLREVLKKHDGTEVKHQGDGFLMTFTSARKAVACAVDIQRAITEDNRKHPKTAVKVRIGLNTGEAVIEGNDIFGEAVHLAARVAAKAQGGQILVSELTKNLVGFSGFRFQDRGEERLKGLKGVHRVYEVMWAKGPRARS